MRRSFVFDFETQYKVTAVKMKDVKAREVQIRTVHDVEGAGLGNQPVQDVDIMQFSLRNMHKRQGDGATKVQ